MSASRTIAAGVVRGKTIELTSETGLLDGQAVTVTIQPVHDEARLPPGEGLRRSFGAWADEGEALDKYLESVRRERKVERRNSLP